MRVVWSRRHFEQWWWCGSDEPAAIAAAAAEGGGDGAAAALDAPCLPHGNKTTDAIIGQTRENGRKREREIKWLP